MGKQLNIAEAKAKLSELIESAQRGEDVVIARAGKPVARLVPIAQVTPSRKNFFGALAHLGPVPEDALEPEPDDTIGDWGDDVDPDLWPTGSAEAVADALFKTPSVPKPNGG